MPGDAITILHLSDPQFGKNHVFGKRALPIADGKHDTLLARTIEDLEKLKQSWSLVPDLIVLTGDLAEWGQKEEFQQCFDFLAGIGKHLSIGPEKRYRIAVIPGNHDINRNLANADYALWLANNKKGDPFGFRRFEFYAEAFKKFYAKVPKFLRPVFDKKHLHQLYRIPELNVVLAGMNSVLAECHLETAEARSLLGAETIYGHHGWCGEDQYKHFAKELAAYEKRGWLRIGLVHHNVIRGATSDDENLTDTNLLKTHLGGVLNLLLHGHTHVADRGLLPQGQPILSTGSAALGQAQRPNETPNQFQVLRITATGVEAWMRAFDHNGRRWLPDARFGGEKTPGRLTLPHAFVNVGVALTANAKVLPAPAKPEEATKSVLEITEQGISGREERYSGISTRMSELAQIASLRWAGARLEWYHTQPPYLGVVTNEAYGFRSFVIGLMDDNELPELQIRAFDEITASSANWERWLVAPRLMRLESAAWDYLRNETSGKRGIRLLSWRDFERMSDLRIAVEMQKEELLKSNEYPPDLYISQGIEFFPRSALGQSADEVKPEPEPPVTDGFAELTKRIEQGGPKFFLIDGDFGAGKTFLLRQLALHFSRDGAPVIPLLIELRSLDKVQNSSDMLITRLGRLGQQEIRPAQLAYMAEAGHLLILFDGYDELALRVSFERAADHLSTITEAAKGKATVVLTCRTQHFKDDHQMVVRLLKQEGLCRARLLPFSQQQIMAFLEKKLDTVKEARERYALIHDIQDLLGLSENPRMLSFIADMPAVDLNTARDAAADGKITAARLYETIIDRWLRNEVRRHSHLQQKDAASGHSQKPTAKSDEKYLAELWEAVTHLAFLSWGRMERPFELKEIQQTLTKLSTELLDTTLAEDERTHGITSGSLLSREGPEAFAFAHYSIPEFLIARELARQFAPQLLQPSVFSPDDSKKCFSSEVITDLMAEFFTDEIGWTTAVELSTEIQKHREKNAFGPYDRRNGARILAVCQMRLEKNGNEEMRQFWHEKMAAKMPDNRTGDDLRGRNLEAGNYAGDLFINADLTQASLRHSDLRATHFENAQIAEADLSRSDLRGAFLMNAKLTRADLSYADLRGADLTGASFSNATLIGADLREAILTGSQWDWARLAGATLDDPQLTGLQAYGAGLPLSNHPSASWASASFVRCVAWSHAQNQIAAGHVDGRITMWNVENGTPKSHLIGHSAQVWSVAFSPNGDHLASSSSDKNLLLWDTATGKILRSLKGHSNRVTSIAFSPCGDCLVSGSSDTTVRLWNVASGKTMHTLEGHSSDVTCVAASQSSDQIVSGSFDKTLRIWKASNGKFLHSLDGHTDSVWGVAFSPTGDRLASGASDMTLRLWDAVCGKPMQIFEGHSGTIRSVAFSPTGDRLASGSDDHTLQIWDVSSGKSLLTLEGHNGPVVSVAFWQGRVGGLVLLVSTCAAGDMRIWDAGTGSCLGILLAYDRAWAALRPDGRYRVVGDIRHHLWHVSGLVRYELGELDNVFPDLKLAEDEPLIPPSYFQR